MIDRTPAFPRSARIKRTAEFRSLIRNAKSVEDDGVILLFAANGGPRSRLGIVITRRAVKLANERNTLKRVVREFFRLNRGRSAGCFDLVVKIKHDHKYTHNNGLREVLARLFFRAGILSNL
jgi:ribonuclease P protein component